MKPAAALLLAIVLSSSQSACLAQFGMDPDPAVSTTLDWVKTRPIYPIIPSMVPDCLQSPKLPFQRLSGKYELTAQQQQSLYDFEAQFVKQVQAKMTDLLSLQRQEQDLMCAAQIDPSKVRDMQKQINDSRDAISNHCLEQQLKALDILTPDQRNELRTLMIKEHNKHHWL